MAAAGAELVGPLPEGLKTLVAAVWAQPSEPAPTRLRAALGLLETAVPAAPGAGQKDAARAKGLAKAAAASASAGEHGRAAELYGAALRLAPAPYTPGNPGAAQLWAGRGAALGHAVAGGAGASAEARSRAAADNRRAVLCAMPGGGESGPPPPEESKAAGPEPVLGGAGRAAAGDGLWRAAGERGSPSGRYVMAAVDMPAGTVVLAELAAAWAVQPAAAAAHCHYCLRPAPISLAVPCAGCSAASYCSGRCRRADANAGHAAECGGPFVKAGLPAAAVLARRVAAGLGSGDWDARLVAKVEALQTHVDSRRIEPGCVGPAAAGLALCAALAGGGPGVGDAATALAEQLWRVETNAMGISELVGGGHLLGGGGGAVQAMEQQRVGLGLFPTAALLNHCCRPTAALRFKLCPPPPAPAAPPTVELVTVRPVRAGEEVSISYGPVAGWMDTPKRRKALEQQYHFCCGCPDCVAAAPPKPKSKAIVTALRRLAAAVEGAEQLTAAAVAGLAAGRPAEGAIQPLQQAVADLADPLLLPPGASPAESAGLWRAAGAAHDCLARCYCQCSPQPDFAAAARHCGASVALLERLVGPGGGVDPAIAEERFKLAQLSFNAVAAAPPARQAGLRTGAIAAVKRAAAELSLLLPAGHATLEELAMMAQYLAP